MADQRNENLELDQLGDQPNGHAKTLPSEHIDHAEEDPSHRQARTNHDDEVAQRSHHVNRSLFWTGTWGSDEQQNRWEPNAITRLDNPFFHWSESEVKTVGQRIALEYGLDRLQPLFIRAAQVLFRNPQTESDWASIEDNGTIGGLEEEERLALQMEHKARFWDQPWPLQTTFLMLFVAAVVQGWNQTATNGANLSWPQDLGLGGDQNVVNTGASVTSGCGPDLAHVWAFAAVNAAPYFAASIGCWFSDPLINELYAGRRGAILVSALLIMGSAIGGAFVKTWAQLLATRILLGLGMGCKAAVVPVFAAEIAPAHSRGAFVMNWQVFDALGIFLGFSSNLVASRAGSLAWRWQIASSAIPAFALLWGVAFVCWDSPRYLMMHEKKYRDRYKRKLAHWNEKQSGRYGTSATEAAERSVERPNGADTTFWTRVKRFARRPLDFFASSPALPYRSAAYETLVLLRGSGIVAAKELIYAHCQLLVETSTSEGYRHPDGNMSFSLESRSSWFRRLKNIFAKSYIRRELYAAAAVMLSQQLCGINALVFYSSSLFCTAGNGVESASSLAPLLLSWGVGLINILFALPAYWLIESHGRRWLLLVTLPCLGAMMAAAAASFRIADPVAMKGVVALFSYGFTIFYSSGLGPVPFTLCAELFPLEERMVGMSLAVSLNMGAAGLLAMFVPRVTDPARLLGIFAGLNAVAFFVIWVFVREVTARPRPSHDDRRSNGPVSLEELFYIFRLRTMTHVRYQLQVYMPYLCYCVMYALKIRREEPELKYFYPWGLKQEAEQTRKSQTL